MRQSAAMPSAHSMRVGQVVSGRASRATMRARADQAVGAAGHRVPLEGDRPDDLRECERQHREVDAGEPHAEPAEQRGAGSGRERAEDQGQLHRQAGAQDEQGGAIRAEAEVRRMAERHHAARAEQEMQADREESEHQHVGEEHQRVSAREHGNQRKSDHAAEA